MIESRILVTFFSASGITRKVGIQLAQVLRADIFEIKPKIPYTEVDLNWMDKKARSTVEMKDKSYRPEVAESISNMEDYDILFVGFPIWWYIAPTIINTFLETYDLSGKTIILFATSGGSNFGKTIANLTESCSKSTRIVEGKIFKNRVSKEELHAWVQSIHEIVNISERTE